MADGSSKPKPDDPSVLRWAINDLRDIAEMPRDRVVHNLDPNQVDRLQDAAKAVIAACPDGEVVPLSEYQKLQAENERLLGLLGKAAAGIREIKDYSDGYLTTGANMDLEAVFENLSEVLAESDPGSPTPAD